MRLRDAFQGSSLGALCGALLACGSPSRGAPANAASKSEPGAGAPRATPDGYNVCARLDDAVDCFACCASFFPLGQQKLLNTAASCTCAASYCGPLSGAGDDAATASDEAGDANTDAEGEDSSAASASEPDGATQGARFGVGRRDAATGFPFGQGACAASMCSLQVAPSQACVKCSLGILTGSEGPPLCPESLAACNADTDCAQLLKCSVFCPAATPD